jgi:hypothetical protein
MIGISEHVFRGRFLDRCLDMFLDRIDSVNVSLVWVVL